MYCSTINKILLSSLIIISFALAQDSTTIDSFRFTLLDAKLDTSLSSDVRNGFQDDDESTPLKSIDIDLNRDGCPEKLIPNEYLCGSGGCPWIIYDQKSRTIIGKIDGKVILVKNRLKNDYCILEVYWSYGAGEGIVLFYELSSSSYRLVSQNEIECEETSRYFK